MDAYGKDGQLARTLVQLNANATEIGTDSENEVNPCLRVVSCHNVFTHRYQQETCYHTCFLRAMPGLRDHEITVRIMVRGSMCTPCVVPCVGMPLIARTTAFGALRDLGHPVVDVDA